MQLSSHILQLLSQDISLLQPLIEPVDVLLESVDVAIFTTNNTQLSEKIRQRVGLQIRYT